MSRKAQIVQMALVENGGSAYFECGKCGHKEGPMRRRDRAQYGLGALKMAYHVEDEHP